MLDLLQVMFQEGKITAREVLAVQKTAEEHNISPVQVMRAFSISSPEDIQATFYNFFNTEILRNEHLALLGTQHSKLLPKDFCEYYAVLPLGLKDKKMVIAMEDPTDLGIRRQIEFLLDKHVMCLAATAFQIAVGLKHIFGSKPESLEWLQPLTAQKVAEEQVKMAIETALTPDEGEAGDNERDNSSQPNLWPQDEFPKPSPQLVASMNQMFIQITLRDHLEEALALLQISLASLQMSETLAFSDDKLGIQVMYHGVTFVFTQTFLRSPPPSNLAFMLPLLKQLYKFKTR